MLPLPPDSPGGVERLTADLVRYARERGHRVSVFDRTATGRSYSGLFSLRALGGYTLSWRLGRLVDARRDEFDVVLIAGMYGWNVHHPRGLAVGHGNVGAYADACRTELSTLAYLKTRYVDLWFHTMSFRRHHLVVVSERTGRECERYHGVAEYTVIDNFVDTDRFRPRPDVTKFRTELGLPRDAFLGLFTGRWEHGKGRDILAGIAGGLGGGHAIVAATPRPFEAPPGVVSLPGLPHDAIARLYNACDYFCLPSRYEGGSLSLLEALASGLPSVVSRVGSADDLSLRDPLLGSLVVDSLDAEPYRRRILRLRREPAYRTRVAARAREYALRHHRLQDGAARYLRLMERIAAGRHEG